MPSSSIALASARIPEAGGVLGTEVFVDDDDREMETHV